MAVKKKIQPAQIIIQYANSAQPDDTHDGTRAGMHKLSLADKIFYYQIIVFNIIVNVVLAYILFNPIFSISVIPYMMEIILSLQICRLLTTADYFDTYEIILFYRTCTPKYLLFIIQVPIHKSNRLGGYIYLIILLSIVFIDIIILSKKINARLSPAAGDQKFIPCPAKVL